MIRAPLARTAAAYRPSMPATLAIGLAVAGALTVAAAHRLWPSDGGVATQALTPLLILLALFGPGPPAIRVVFVATVWLGISPTVPAALETPLSDRDAGSGAFSPWLLVLLLPVIAGLRRSGLAVAAGGLLMAALSTVVACDLIPSGSESWLRLPLLVALALTTAFFSLRFLLWLASPRVAGGGSGDEGDAGEDDVTTKSSDGADVEPTDDDDDGIDVEPIPSGAPQGGVAVPVLLLVKAVRATPPETLFLWILLLVFGASHWRDIGALGGRLAGHADWIAVFAIWIGGALASGLAIASARSRRLKGP